MNNIRAVEALNQRELEAGIPLSASWHTDWADTAYVYIGGLPYELSEGDIITIFSQFGEPVHVNLIRHKDTGKSKGFAFLKYEDQKSTSLAVDNLGGATILGRVIRVDHTRYEPKEGEVVDENAYQDLGEKPKDNSDRERRGKRGKGRGGDDGRRMMPPREMLKEELELQKLIQDHDEEDPMKGYLIQQKKEDLEMALGELKKQKLSKHRGKSDSEHRHRSHRHRSGSKERSGRQRSGSKDHRRSVRSYEETGHARGQGEEVRRKGVDDKGRPRDKGVRRETTEKIILVEVDMPKGQHSKERGGGAINQGETGL